ncbi:hypothetical protein, partial [Thermococcus sp.]|uniref:hypothetical protein n=1 Tax=Thermococcus sp. TaxID=35749 RepID=UPI002639EEB9
MAIVGDEVCPTLDVIIDLPQGIKYEGHIKGLPFKPKEPEFGIIGNTALFGNIRSPVLKGDSGVFLPKVGV